MACQGPSLSDLTYYTPECVLLHGRLVPIHRVWAALYRHLCPPVQCLSDSMLMVACDELSIACRCATMAPRASRTKRQMLCWPAPTSCPYKVHDGQQIMSISCTKGQTQPHQSPTRLPLSLLVEPCNFIEAGCIHHPGGLSALSPKMNCIGRELSGLPTGGMSRRFCSISSACMQNM